MQVELGATLRSCFEEAERAAEEGARICPALDELYSLNGQPTEDAYTAEIATLMSFVRANLHECEAFHLATHTCDNAFCIPRGKGLVLQSYERNILKHVNVFIPSTLRAGDL